MGFRTIILSLFILLAAAGCKKSISIEIPHSDEPTPILLSASATNHTTTKAYIEKWNDTKVNIFGLKQNNGIYDYDDPSNIVDKEAVISSDNRVSLYSDDQAKAPYYYSDGEVYDFYGYHLGGADVTEVKKGADSYSMSVVLHGNNDLLYASTDRNKDLMSYTGSELNVHYLYSSFSARRGVHPVLRFSHALTRFKFIVKGAGDSYDMFQVAGLKVEAGNTGTLVLGKDLVGFTPSDEIGIVKLKAGDDDFEISTITSNASSEPLGGENSSIMVVPGQTSIKVTLELFQSSENRNTEFSFEVNASDIPITDENERTYYSDTFLAGYSYNIIMYVYGAEKIEISSAVDKWFSGGEFEVDPDGGVTPIEKPESPYNKDIESNVTVGDYEEGGDLGNIELNI